MQRNPEGPVTEAAVTLAGSRGLSERDVHDLLDVSIVAVALPSIGRSTGAGPAELQWVVSGYALAFGMVTIIGGRLGDDRGRKRMLLLDIAGFVVCSAAVGLALIPGTLIRARVLQGLAVGLIGRRAAGCDRLTLARRARQRAQAGVPAL